MTSLSDVAFSHCLELGLGVARVCGLLHISLASRHAAFQWGIFGVSKKTLCPTSVILPEYVVLLCFIIYWAIRSVVLSDSCTFFRWPHIVPHVALILYRRNASTRCNDNLISLCVDFSTLISKKIQARRGFSKQLTISVLFDRMLFPLPLDNSLAYARNSAK